MSSEFKSLHEKAVKAHKDYLAGRGTKEVRDAAAKAAADHYNKKAREVAKRLGTSPRLTTPGKIVRSDIR